MPIAELVFRPDVEDGRSSAAQAVEQLIARNRLELVASPELACHHTRDFGAGALADATESAEQPDYRVVAGQPIIDALAVAAALYKRSTAEELQVSRCIGEGEGRTARQILDAALALSEMFEQFKPMRMSKRMGDLGETLKNLLFRAHS